jgi:tetratricopeptide (TPR) repeat protein
MRAVVPLVALLLFSAVSIEAEDALARGEALLERKEYAEAEAALREATAADPSSARAHGSLALALLYQRKIEPALEEGRLAVACDAGNPEARLIYGRALAAARRPLEAARELEAVLAARPDDLVALEGLAQSYAAAQDERAAVAAYEKLVKLRPDTPDPRVRLADYFWSARKPEAGNRVIEDALRAFPDSPFLHAFYGRSLLAQERVVDAARELKLARDGGITDQLTLSLLCHALWRSGDAEAAVEAFTATLKQYPSAASLHEDLGRLLLGLGRPEQALVSLEEAVRQRPEQASARLDLGRAYEALGKPVEAEQAYRKAMVLEPQLAAPHYALGRLLIRRGDSEEGQRELALYRTLYDRTARLRQEAVARAAEISLAWSELRQGRAEAALARFESFPEATETLIGQASALSSLRRHQDAVRVLERARELEPESPRIQALLSTERARSQDKP